MASSSDGKASGADEVPFADVAVELKVFQVVGQQRRATDPLSKDLEEIADFLKSNTLLLQDVLEEPPIAHIVDSKGVHLMLRFFSESNLNRFWEKCYDKSLAKSLTRKILQTNLAIRLGLSPHQLLFEWSATEEDIIRGRQRFAPVQQVYQSHYKSLVTPRGFKMSGAYQVPANPDKSDVNVDGSQAITIQPSSTHRAQTGIKPCAVVVAIQRQAEEQIQQRNRDDNEHDIVKDKQEEKKGNVTLETLIKGTQDISSSSDVERQGAPVDKDVCEDQQSIPMTEQSDVRDQQSTNQANTVNRMNISDGNTGESDIARGNKFTGHPADQNKETNDLSMNKTQTGMKAKNDHTNNSATQPVAPRNIGFKNMSVVITSSARDDNYVQTTKSKRPSGTYGSGKPKTTDLSKVSMEFHLFISKDLYNTVKSVRIISDHPDLQSIDFPADKISGRVWKSVQTSISVTEDITYKYSITHTHLRGLHTISKEESEERTLSLKSIQRDIFKDKDMTAGHFTFIDHLITHMATFPGNVKDSLMVCTDLGFSVASPVTMPEMVSFLEDKLTQFEMNFTAEQGVFLTVLTGMAFSNRVSKPWQQPKTCKALLKKGLRIKSAKSLLESLRNGNNSMIPSHLENDLLNVMTGLLSLALGEVSWVDVLYYFLPLLGLSSLQQCRASYRRICSFDAQKNRLTSVVGHLCAIPQTEVSAKELINAILDVNIAIQVYNSIEKSNLAINRDDTLSFTRKKILDLLKVECDGLKTWFNMNVEKISSLIDTVQQLEDQIKSECEDKLERHVIQWVKDSTPVGDPWVSFTRLLRDSLIFTSFESSYELLLAMAKSRHQLIFLHLLQVLKYPKFQFMGEKPHFLQQISREWMKNAENNRCDDLKTPYDLWSYYYYLANILDNDMIKTHCSNVLEEDAKFRLQSFSVEQVLTEAPNILAENDVVHMKIIEHIGAGKGNVPITESLLHGVQPFIGEKLAPVLVRALSSTTLVNYTKTSLNTDLKLLEEVMRHLSFWMKLNRSTGSHAEEVRSHETFMNLRKLGTSIVQSVKMGTIELHQFEGLESQCKGRGCNNAVDFLGTLAGGTERDTREWQYSYKQTTCARKRATDAVNDVDAFVGYLRKVTDEPLSDVDEMKYEIQQCRNQLHSGRVTVGKLRSDLGCFLGQLSSLFDGFQQLRHLRNSGTFEQFCRKVPFLQMRRSTLSEMDDSFAGAPKIFRTLDDPMNSEKLIGADMTTVTCTAFASFLAGKCKDKFMDALHEKFFSNGEIVVSDIVDMFPCRETLLRELNCVESVSNQTFSEEVMNGFVAYKQFPEMVQTIKYARTVLHIFKFEADDRFKMALEVADRLHDEKNLTEMTLSAMTSAYNQLKEAIGNITKDHGDFLRELSHSNDLIEFLLKHIDEDLRNLVNAVEEYSEHHMQQSTVADFVQVKQFVMSVKRASTNLQATEFFAQLQTSSNLYPRLAEKLQVCNQNTYGLKLLYHNVANRGEVSQELICNALREGKMVLEMKEDSCRCDVRIQYKKNKRSTTLNQTQLEELQSRALLLLNTDKTTGDESTRKERKEDFASFIDMMNKLLDTTMLLEELHNEGHSKYKRISESIKGTKIEKIKKLNEWLQSLKDVHQTWKETVQDLRARYYLLNFVHGEQLWILHDFIYKGTYKEKAIPILRYICPSLTPTRETFAKFQPVESKESEKDLENLGQALCHWGNNYRQRRPFPHHVMKDVSKQALNISPSQVFVVRMKPNSQKVIHVMLSLYAETTKVLPEPWQVMVCHRSTTWSEISLFVGRCKHFSDQTEDKVLFCMANVELLLGENLNSLIDEVKELFESNVKQGSSHLALICRGNIHHPLFDHFYEDIHVVPGLPDSTLKRMLRELCPNVYLLTSQRPGMGKSSYITKQLLGQQQSQVHLCINGPISHEQLVQKMSGLQLQANVLLHIDIQDTTETELLDNFIFQLIIFGQVSHDTKIVQLQTKYVAIEVANTMNEFLKESLTFTSLIACEQLEWQNYKDFDCSAEVQIVAQHLKFKEMNMLDKKDIVIGGPSPIPVVSEDECRQLLWNWLPKENDMSFSIANIVLNVLSSQLSRMSKSPFFTTSNLQTTMTRREPLKIKSASVDALVQTCTDFASRSIKSYQSTQTKTHAAVHSGIHLDKEPLADQMARRMKGMIQWENSNHLMIVFHPNGESVTPFYRNVAQVDEQTQYLFLSQGWPLDDFKTLPPDELQIMIERVAGVARENTEAMFEDASQQHIGKGWYALTPDNMLKMVLILLRIQSQIPVIIMGETGCGKTSLVRYLASICRVKFKTIPLHAGVIADQIVTLVNEEHQNAEKQQCTTWIFFDEVNTCLHLGLVCEILCHHTCNGEKLSQNLVFIAACNPYRVRHHRNQTAGIEGKIKMDDISKLVYRVHPLPETMVDYVWDYGMLLEEDEKAYIERMVSIASPTCDKQKLMHVLCASQNFMRDKENVSLRDVDRCLTLMNWFENNMFKVKPIHVLESEMQMIPTGDRSLILALTHCYYSRLGSKQAREDYLSHIALAFFGKKDKWKLLDKIITEEQMNLLDKMEIPPGIAKNIALRENVFVVLVCILNRIPVFLTGKPGSSKSLSVQILRNSLRGLDSADEYLKKLPALLVVAYQGSESSTSDGICKVFEKARSNIPKRTQPTTDDTQHTAENILPVVLLDEIGLAEISRFNPLKVLHNLLEPVSGEKLEVAVVGISNWALDAAKMNRAVHLSRPDLDADELYMTGCSMSALQTGTDLEKILQALSQAFSEYQSTQNVRNFHGLRDYYSLVKYISVHHDPTDTHNDNTHSMDIIETGILRNFGGIQAKINDFLMIVFRHLQVERSPNQTSIESLITANLQDRNARHLMIITNGETAMQVLHKVIREEKRECETIIGSKFEEDQTEDYSYRILSRIILLMERGCVLILKDLDTIYGSLYDMLNQNYSYVGKKKICRIALGPYSNPMCQVHDDFRCIVIEEESKVDYSDPPFLNRFEKQIVRFEDILTESEQRDLYRFQAWLEMATNTPEQRHSAEECFMGYSKEALPIMALQLKKESTEEEFNLLENLKKYILWTASPAAALRLCRSNLAKENQDEVRLLVQEYFQMPLHLGLINFTKYLKNCREKAENCMPLLWDGTPGFKLVVYTNSSLHASYHSLRSDEIQDIRLSSFKSEVEMTMNIRAFWFESKASLLVIHCKPSLDEEHLELIKFQTENCRFAFQHSQHSVHADKNVCIVVHLEKGTRPSIQRKHAKYLSGWQAVYIDDLEQQTEHNGLVHLLQSSPPDILHSGSPIQLSECIMSLIPEALLCLKPIHSKRSSNENQVLLQQICTSEILRDALKEHILQNLRNVLESVPSSLDKYIWHPHSWQVKLSCDVNCLMNTRTFRRAVLHYFKEMVRVSLSKLLYQLDSFSLWTSILSPDTDGSLKELWRKMFMEWIAIDNIPDPSGVECYDIHDPICNLKYPFSKLLYAKLQPIRNKVGEFRERISMEPDATNQNGDLVGIYQNKLVSYTKDCIMHDTDVFPYLPTVGYGQLLVEDLCNLFSSQCVSHLDENIRVKVTKWVVAMKDLSDSTEEDQVLSTLFTLWHEQDLITSILQFFCLENIPEKIWHLVEDSRVIKESSISNEDCDEVPDIDTIHDPGLVVADTTPEDSLTHTLCLALLNDPEVKESVEGIEDIMMLNQRFSRWQNKMNILLTCASRISIDSPLLHSLRLCSDYITYIQLPHGPQFQHMVHFIQTVIDTDNEGILSDALFAGVKDLIQPLRDDEVPWISLQCFLCQYIVRILTFEPSTDLLPKILKLIEVMLKGSETVKFMGPIFDILLTFDEEDDYQEDRFLPISMEILCQQGEIIMPNEIFSEVNESIKQCDFDAASKIVILCTDILRIKLDEAMMKIPFLNIKSSSDRMLEALRKAMGILSKPPELSLQLSIAAAYVKSFHDQFAHVLCRERNMRETVQNMQLVVNAICSGLTSEEEGMNSPSQKIACNIFRAVQHEKKICLKELQDTLSSLEERIFPISTMISFPESEIINTIGYNPLSYCPEYKPTLDSMKLLLKTGDTSKLVLDNLHLSIPRRRAILACTLELFFFPGIFRQQTDMEQKVGKKLSEMMAGCTGLQKPFINLIQYFLGFQQFQSNILNITEGSAIDDIQKIFFLLSFICMVVADIDETCMRSSNCTLFMHCLVQPEILQGRFIPTIAWVGTNTETNQLLSIFSEEVRLQKCKCKLLYTTLDTGANCNVCGETSVTEQIHQYVEEENKPQRGYSNSHMEVTNDTQMQSRNLPPVSFRYLHLLIHGALALSSEMKVGGIGALMTNVDNKIAHTTRQFMRDWEILMKLSNCTSQELYHSLCTLIWAMKERGNMPYNGHKQEDLTQYEEAFNDVVKELFIHGGFQETFLNKTTQSFNYRLNGIESFVIEAPMLNKTNICELPIWTLFRKVKPKALCTFVSQFQMSGLQQDNPLLDLYLRYQKVLSLVKFIYPIKEWLLVLWASKGHNISRSNAQEWSVNKLLHKEKNEQTKQRLKDSFQAFKNAWTEICNQGETIQKLDPSFPELIAIRNDDKLERSIVSTKESCVFHVVLLLGRLQNEFLDKALRIATSQNTPVFSFLQRHQGGIQLPIVPLQNASKLHIIGDVKLEGIMQRHSEWHTEYGKGYMIHYNFTKIEAELASQILLGKVHLSTDSSFPVFVYSGELFQTSANIMNYVRQVIPQSPLPKSVMEKIREYQELNPDFHLSLFRKVETILYYLRGTEANRCHDLNLEIASFVSKWVPKLIAQEVLESFRNIDCDELRTTHVVALFEYLENVLSGNGESLQQKFKRTIDDSLKKDLTLLEDKKVCTLEALKSAIHRFIFRWLWDQETQRSTDDLEALGPFLADETLWTEVGEINTQIRFQKQLFLKNFPEAITLGHLYDTLQHVHNTIEQRRRKDEPTPVRNPTRSAGRSRRNRRNIEIT